MPCGLAGATAARIKASVTQANAAARARRMANAHNPRGSRLDMPLARPRQWVDPSRHRGACAARGALRYADGGIPGARRSRPSSRWKFSRPRQRARRKARVSSTWRPGSRARARPSPFSPRRRRSWPPKRSATPRPMACCRCASASPSTMKNATASPRRLSVSWSRPAPQPGSFSLSSPPSTSATGWRSPIPAIPPTATRCRRSGSSRCRSPRPRRRPAFSPPWRCWKRWSSRSRA